MAAAALLSAALQVLPVQASALPKPGSIQRTLVSGTHGSWHMDTSGKWRFYRTEDSYVSNCWEEIDQEWYHFDQFGYREIGWIKDSDGWYYLYDNGVMARNTWIGSNYVNARGQFVANKWIKDGDAWSYELGDGTTPKNRLCIIDGETYLFDHNGHMYKGWFQMEGKDYFFSSDGIMQKNRWVGEYYVDENGVWIPDAWKQKNGKWYYRYGDGTYPFSTLKEISGETYYFDAAGYMKTGWLQVPYGYRYFDSAGKMIKNKVIDGWYISADGIAYF